MQSTASHLVDLSWISYEESDEYQSVEISCVHPIFRSLFDLLVVVAPTSSLERYRGEENV